MVKLVSGAVQQLREGVYHTRLRRLDTESLMDSSPTVLRPLGLESIIETYLRIVS